MYKNCVIFGPPWAWAALYWNLSTKPQLSTSW